MSSSGRWHASASLPESTGDAMPVGAGPAEGTSAVVIGGGIAGLLAAERLVGSGVTVTLLEASNRLGGIVRTDHMDGSLLEGGPDGLLASRPATDALIERLGLGRERIEPSAGGSSVLWGGRLHPIPPLTVLGVPSSLAAMARSSLFGARDVARMALDLALPAHASSADVSVGELVRRRLGAAAVERLVGPLVGGINGGDVDRLSVAAAAPQLAAWLRADRSLIRGARRTVRSGRPPSPFVSLRGGMGRLVEALVARLAAAELCTGEAAIGLRRTADGWRVTTDRRELSAALVVLATPPPAAATLLGAALASAGTGASSAAASLRRIAVRPAAIVHLAFSGTTPAFGGHGFVVAGRERRPITAATVASAKWPGRAPPGIVLIRAYAATDLAGPGGPADDELTRLVVSDVRELLGIRAEPTFSSVHRIPDAQSIREVGHLERVQAARSDLASAGPVAIVGGAFDGPGIPAIAEAVDREVARLLGIAVA